MCVIAIKKRGVEFPKDDSISAMWDTNSDGAGFMYAHKDKVIIEKGFMKLSDFQNAIKKVSKAIKKDGVNMTDIPMVLHFRITTHGGTSPQLTHPFPISSQERHLKALDLTCDLGLVHNGIISSITTQVGLSDTATYIANILTPLAYMKNDFYMSKEGKTIMENTIGASKFAFLDKFGNIETLGDFKNGTKHDTTNILFSNLNHEWDFKGTSTCYGHGTYKDSRALTPYYGSSTLPYEDYDEEVSVIKLPVGVYLANTTYGTIAKPLEIKEKDNFFMDKYGDLYLQNKYKVGYLSPSYYYDTAYIKDKGGAFITIDADYFSGATKILKKVGY